MVIMCNEQMYKELGRKRVWVGGLGLWEEQSPIDKKLLLFKSGRTGLTNFGNITFDALNLHFLLSLSTEYFSIQRLMLTLYVVDWK